MLKQGYFLYIWKDLKLFKEKPKEFRISFKNLTFKVKKIQKNV